MLTASDRVPLSWLLRQRVGRLFDGNSCDFLEDWLFPAVEFTGLDESAWEDLRKAVASGHLAWAIFPTDGYRV